MAAMWDVMQAERLRQAMCVPMRHASVDRQLEPQDRQMI
jgi:hypothetical protein